MLTMVAGVVCAMADNGADNRGKTNKTLTSKLSKGFFIVFLK
jgi:hypothetical protein